MSLVGIEQPVNAREAAEFLRSCGFALCKPDPAEKKPTYKGWPTRSLEADDFAAGDMIGILGGPLSTSDKPGHALVIIDLDSAQANERADDYLFDTAMVEGRAGKRRSHRYYLVPVESIPDWAKSTAEQGAAAAIDKTGHPGPFTKSFRHRETDAEVFKFVGTGGQCVCPPSVWASADGARTERREWEGGEPGKPAVIPFLDLWRVCGELASACGAKIPDAAPPSQSFKLRTPATVERARAYLDKIPGAVSGSGGHGRTFAAARAMVWGFDLGEQAGFELLRDHYNSRCEPQWSEKELRHKCEDADRVPSTKPRGWLRDAEGGNGGAKSGSQETPPRSEGVTANSSNTPLPLLYYGNISPALDAADFVEGLLIDGAMSVIYGESGCGKTFFALDLSLHVAAGLTWRNREVDRRGVLYLALEGSHGIKNRVAAFKLAYKANAADFSFAVVPVAVNLLDPGADTNKVIDAAKVSAEKLAKPVGLIVVDTLSRALAGGNENAPEDMGAFVRNVDRIRQALPAHVSIVHHSGKDGARGARGHSLLRAATDTEIEVTRNPDGISVARVTKQRELDAEGVFAFRLQSVELGRNRRGKPVTSCVVREAEAPAAESHLAPGAQAALNALVGLISESGCKGFAGVPAGVLSVAEAAWRERFYSTCKPCAKPEARRKAFGRAVDDLIAAEKVRSFDDRVWIHAPGQSGTKRDMSRPDPGQNGTHPLKGCPVSCPTEENPWLVKTST